MYLLAALSPRIANALAIGVSAFVVFSVLVAASGCRTGDPADVMIRQVDAAPPEKQPPDWNNTRQLMSRQAPAVGDFAPDFTLKTSDGAEAITRSKFQPGKPQVLIFGSFT